MKQLLSLALALVLISALAGCGVGTASLSHARTTPASIAEAMAEPSESTSSSAASEPVETGVFAEQIYAGADGDIYKDHGGANVVFDDPDNLNWVISHSKG